MRRERADRFEVGLARLAQADALGVRQRVGVAADQQVVAQLLDLRVAQPQRVGHPRRARAAHGGLRVAADQHRRDHRVDLVDQPLIEE